MINWNYIGNIANIFGIISFPIAIYELFSIKSKMKKAQESMNEILALKDYQTLSELLNIVSKMQDDLSQLRIKASQRGINKDVLHNQCQDLIKDFNICILKVPPEHEKLLAQFINGKEYIQQFIENNFTKDLREAQRSLHSIIMLLKKLNNHIIMAEAERIAKSE